MFSKEAVKGRKRANNHKRHKAYSGQLNVTIKKGKYIATLDGRQSVGNTYQDAVSHLGRVSW